MISYRNVTKIYRPDIVALDDVSLDIESGGFVSIIGKSGSGKTTLLKLLLAEEKPTQGQVFFENHDVHLVSASNLPDLRKNIGVIFQDYRLLGTKTVYENIAYVMEVMGVEDKDISRDVKSVLEIVDLLDKINQFPRQLSGGEKQRVAIARALIHRPQVIVADEPTGNLDPYHTRDIIRLLVRINELKTTIILATHNKEVINRLGRRVVTLDNGVVIRDEQKGRFVL
ncbi:cell division ATP-binding protein FtsE [Patescibacteria group bacterium]|nr:cell division ATP-binding protein FtsE [Patescibacteria group bacterium]